MRGRVSAVNSVFIGASNQLGEFESGATAALLGPVGAVVAGGVGTLWWCCCGGAGSRRWPGATASPRPEVGALAVGAGGPCVPRGG
jgi:hypothetical protein